VDEWLRYWNSIYEKYGRCFILITGGEPFTYPNFIELIEKLSLVHYPINISTNASSDLESFVERIDPGRVSLSVSLQPDFDKVDLFLEKVKFLRKHKFDGCINFVAYPPYLKDIGFYLERFNAIGEKLKIIPFWGRYQEKEYPFAYTLQERDAIGIDGAWFNKVRKKDSLCPAGYNSALVFPDGKVARCGQIGERMLVGNFFDSEFKLLDEPSSCDAEFCPCDENKLFGEEEDTIVDYKNRRDDQMNNSSLNDQEYNEGRIILQSSPKAIFIQAAGPCNSNCVFCSRGPEYEIFNLDTHRRRFEKDLYPFIGKAEQLILTGSGEYLRLSEAPRILEFFDTNFPDVEKIFSTNGSSLVPWVCEKIVNSKSKYTIHVSLHSSNPSLHKVLTRMDNFHKILGQIRHFLELRKDKKSPKVHLIFVATTLNIEDLPNFVRLAADLDVDKVICYYNYIYIPTQKYLSCFFKQELTNKMLNEAGELANKLKIDIALPPRFSQKEYPNLGPCREAFSQIMFDSQGHVLPCDASEDCGEVLGDGKSFTDVWNSQYYQKLRKSLLEGNCPCFKHCLRANPQSVNDFKSHVIYRGGRKDEDIHILWGDNF
jgi:MoaA/NifB/PqqE/SkfB family radical SAM enzyme